MSARCSPGFIGLAVLLVGACRDAPEPFVPPEREPLGGPAWQLTYNLGDDRAPAWTADGQNVIYTAVVDTQPGLLLSIPYRGGTAVRALGAVQADTSAVRRFTTPAASPSGEALAFVHFIRLFDTSLCGTGALSICDAPSHPWLPYPRLGTAWLRVRRFADSGSVDDDPRYEIDFAGRFFDETADTLGLPGVYVIDHFPFHQVYLAEDRQVFRPSWSPDSRHIAFSDGLQVLIWDVESGELTPVPGTEDGVAPAWSPDGQWIAFTRLERLGTASSFCRLIINGILTCAERSTVYTMGRRLLTLVRPDGSELREIGEGDEPAWAADGTRLYYVSLDRIWSQDLEGGIPMLVSGTSGGREPAASPDGRLLAFAQRGDDGTYSIWIVSLEP